MELVKIVLKYVMGVEWIMIWKEMVFTISGTVSTGQ
jgi:hypothetical protein